MGYETYALTWVNPHFGPNAPFRRIAGDAKQTTVRARSREEAQRIGARRYAGTGCLIDAEKLCTANAHLTGPKGPRRTP